MAETTFDVLSSNKSTRPGGRTLNLVCWGVQALLACSFLGSAWWKLGSASAAATQLHLSVGFVVFIGLAELAGAIGLILPAATGVMPRLTLAAAVGLTLLTLCAVVYHVLVGAVAESIPAIVMGLLSGFVVWARSRAPRTT